MRARSVAVLSLVAVASALQLPRQATSSAGPVSLASTNPTAIPISSIYASMPTQGTTALDTTYTAGATPPVSGAPALPTAVIVPTNYPALDQVPPINSPQVQQWIKDVQNSGVFIPGLTPTQAGETWGVSYDDGPSPYTPNLLQYLDQQQLKSTFFIVGSRAISRPQILQTEYMGGHQLSVHTWSHPSLTTLTTEQIIAELGWTKKAIKDITGVTPNTMRPPYGDIDDRVRAISKAMGLTPIIWTSVGGTDFDTNDWHVPSGLSSQAVLSSFEAILTEASSMNTGFIVLSHDLYQQTVDLATGYIIPDALARGFHLQNIITCMKKPLSEAYIETSSNGTSPASTGTTPAAGSSETKSGTVAPTATAKASSTGSAAQVSASVATLFFFTGLCALGLF
ncbi:chitin deacetylase [Ceratobasidium sp. 414]|nr:chitin deacetylase [Ceratobasidium sp. 414]